MKNKKWIVVLLIVTLQSLACGDESSASATPQVEALSAEVSDRLRTVLDDYEALRAALAEDRLSDVSGLATRLGQNVNAARQDASAAVIRHLEVMSTAAAQLIAGGSANDQRQTFGDLSRAVVTLLSEHRALTAGRYIFDCPMAQDYPKWVQLNEDMANPYMGQRMLRCGTASDWTP